MKEYYKRLDKLLIVMDVDGLWTLRCGNVPIALPYAQRASFEAGCHKARYLRTTMPPALRDASRAWLEARGLSWQMNMEWPPKGEYP